MEGKKSIHSSWLSGQWERHSNTKSFFAKVAGVSENKRQYWNKVQEISSHELSLTIRSFPIANPVSGNNHYHYQNALGTDGTLDPEKMINGNWWRYKDLPSGLQKGLAAAISRYCAMPKLKIMPHEDLYQLQLYLFNQSMNIPTTFLELLQKFDYSQDIPKVIFINYSTKCVLKSYGCSPIVVAK
ncbi:hypothetical protein GCM10020331_004270 [Ectobacillus funiculus]